jgi:phytoene dehydrogenase-like protein
MKIVVVGAGMGGLAAALRLRRRGHEVCVVEARAEPGGLASSFTAQGLRFDAGPYVLLDRPGLEWALAELGLSVDALALRRIEDVYEVAFPDGTALRFQHDLAATADGFERRWPGAGARYTRFVRESERIYRRLQPLLTREHSLRALAFSGAWRHAPFLVRSLGAVLARTGLPKPLIDSLGIWTHVAGQELAQAPSPLGFVPALIHGVGAFLPADGIGAVPRLIAGEAVRAGVELRLGTRVRRIVEENGRAVGVETDAGVENADAVISNYNAGGTALELLSSTPPRARARLTALPMQSPGACAYLALRGAPRGPYMRFYLPGGDERCRLLVQPGAHDPACAVAGEYPARLIAPIDYARAARDDDAGQAAHLQRLVDEPWWRSGVDGARVVESRTPRAWGRAFFLYADSMNPVMTARLMRQGRLPHKSPFVDGLYQCGSSTHPGQWVSFCAISGVLAADRLHRELA